MWQVEFESSEFLPELPEECQANPGIYGFELALWLSQTLAREKIGSSYPLGEDWGWYVDCSQDAEGAMLCCSSRASEFDGYAGKPITWIIYIKPYRTFGQWLRKDPRDATVRHFADAVLAALATKGILPRIVGS